MEAAAQVVADPARRHAAQRVERHVEGRRGARARVLAQEHLQRHRLGELGCAAEAAVGRVVLAGHGAHGTVEERLTGERRAAALGRRFVRLAQGREEVGSALADVFAAIAPGACGGVEDLAEGRHPLARGRGEVRPTVVGLARRA